MHMHAADVQARIKTARASHNAVQEQLQAAKRRASSTEAECMNATAALKGAHLDKFPAACDVLWGLSMQGVIACYLEEC